MRIKRAFYTIVSQSIYEFVTAVCSFILPRLILGMYGSNYNGVISSITQLISYISLLALGVSGATRVALYRAKDDIAQKSSIVRATEIYLRKVSQVLIAYIAALAIIYPYLVREHFTWAESASLVIIIGFGEFIKYCFGVTIEAFLCAEQCEYINWIVMTVCRIVSTVVSVVLIRMGQSIQVVELLSVLCFAVKPVFLNFYVKKRFKLLRNVEPNYAQLDTRKDVMGHSIANTIHSSTDVFLLTLISGPAIVSVYSVYALVFNSLKKIQEIFTSGLEGAFGTIWARGEYELFARRFNTFEYLICVYVSVIFPCAAILLLPFIKLYIANVNDADYILPAFAMLSVVTHGMYCMRMPYLIAVQAAGKYKETKKAAYLEAGLNFSISLVLVFRWNLIGVTLGTLAANVFRTVQYSLFSSKHLLNKSYFEVIKRFLWVFLNAALIIALAHLMPPVQYDTWTQWVISGVKYALLSVAVVFLTSALFFRKDLYESWLLLKTMLNNAIGRN